MKKSAALFLFVVLATPLFISCKEDTPENAGVMQLASCFVGQVKLNYPGNTADVPYNKDITINFSAAVDSASAVNNIKIKKNSTEISFSVSFSNEHKAVVLKPTQPLEVVTSYTLDILSTLRGEKGETFPGIQFTFVTATGQITINAITINNYNFLPPAKVNNIPLSGTKIHIEFSDPVNTTQLSSAFYISGGIPMNITTADSDKSVEVSFGQNFAGYTTYNFTISSDLKGANGFSFNGFSNSFFTALDSSLKFPLISDEQLLTLVQHQTFKYF